MFIKSFKIKSNVQLKSSDRKKLQTRISARFTITDSELNQLFPNKASVSLVKIITHSEEIITVYAVDKKPVFFETPGSVLLPTVYALWELPDLIPLFTTHPDVLPRLAKGANLMLPGVIRQGQGRQAYGHYRKDDIVGVNLTSNKAAVGVGFLARSSDDLYMCGGVGVCVNMIHVFGDKLWSIESTVCQQIPILGTGFEMPKPDDFPTLGTEPGKKSLDNITQKLSMAEITRAVSTTATTSTEDFPALGMGPKRNKIPQKPFSNDEVKDATEIPLDKLSFTHTLVASIENDESSEDTNAEEDEPKSEIVEECEDDVLQTAFYTALKREGRQLTLPLLTSTFYRCHVVPAVDRPIDLKKTSYKKLSKFLAEMANKRFITVKEEQKGVEKIVAINLDHPDLVEFVPKAVSKENAEGQSGNNLFVTEMTELYLVTDETAKFFTRFNIANGEGVEKSRIKKILKEYVCNNKLQSPLNPHIVRCNELLFDLCQHQEIEFDRLFSHILLKMTHSFEMRSKNEIKTSKNPMIQMQLATRSGNKKVTLINNLEAFGIRIAEFEKQCKIGVAASTSVTKLANQKGEQLLVQGNQIRFVHKLLTETYKIPSKNIVGMELAKKEKKAKKK